MTGRLAELHPTESRQMERIRLDGSGSGLVLRCAEDGWCGVELHAPDGIVPVGVQGIRYISRGLIDFFERATDELQLVLFLLDRNVSVYGKRLDGSILFKLEDANGKFLGGFIVDVTQQQSWIDLLLPHI